MNVLMNVDALKNDWQFNKRWEGIKRPYTAEDVVRLRGSIQIEHTLARMGAERLWQLLQEEEYVHALGALTRQPGRADGAGRPQSHLSQRLAGRRRRQPGRPNLSRPEPLPGQQRPRWSSASTTPCSAPTRFTTPTTKTASTGSPPSSPTPNRVLAAS
jgi:hypothetical protein